MLRAHSKRLSNRTVVVGKTAFVFDKNGNTAVVDQGNVRYDYEQLLKMNQVVAIVDEAEALVPDPPTVTATEPDPPGEVATTAPVEPEPKPEPTATADVDTSASEPEVKTESESEPKQNRKKKMRRPAKKDDS